MALRSARKIIPKDVRQESARLYGPRREAHFELRVDTPHNQAKAQQGAWEAEVETRKCVQEDAFGGVEKDEDFSK